MRREILTSVLLILLRVSVLSAQHKIQNTQNVKVTIGNTEVQVQFYSPSVVHIVKVPVNDPYEHKSLVINKIPDRVSVIVKRQGGLLTMISKVLTVTLNEKNGRVNFFDKKGNHLLTDSVTTFRPKDDAGKPSYTVKGAFILNKTEPIYGIGQVMDNKFNRRGASYQMKNENTFTYSPYFMSVKGYGVYWDNYSVSNFSDKPGELAFESLGQCADYYFMYGGNADGVIKRIRSLSGKAPMLPLWAYGFFQSRERYKTQDESLDVLKKYRELHVPIDVIIQDWRYWPEYKGTDSAWNSQLFDPERFPQPKQWADEIHKLHAKLMIVTWPGFGPKTDQRKELDSKKMIINFDTWPPNSGARPYDVYNPAALDIYWKYLNKRIFSYIGNDGWWLDSTEPDHINVKDSDFDLPTHLGSYRSVKNAFSLMHNGGIATHQKETLKSKRVVLLTRSGFIGQQRYGSNTWSGDVPSSWEMLQKQIPAALNYSLMGIPNWNSDIGGFFAGGWVKGGGAKNPGFQELYLRWMQFGAFCPMMRSHGTDVPREIYNFGNPGDWCFDGQQKMINLRYRLLPYNYSTAWDVSKNDGTFMRPLVMDFAADGKTHEIGNEYMFGRSLLVSPVTKPDVKTWPVYLPKGADWLDFWIGERVAGGQTIDKEVPKDIIPIFVKAGTILPWGPSVQYSGEKSWDDLEFRIYPGADGSFTLYEDEKDNYDYEKGLYSTIDFKWNDLKRELTIAARKGKFPGMIAIRKFRIAIVKPSENTGMDANNIFKTIDYDGREINIKVK
ncbi:DUF5110 domain-containing protein [Mucilaginibacter sp. 21P]|uniref:glycoside hydrolase family 31 protein n=1 Tax=Mucilaginibacter sp. 21P TaxID=2778902 RepID=UPI001C5713F2|nr:TIM-barrel domain-containing protein [Mucilaginibacter sp. 21P]QXV64255.1 DUF5110 domain-containing protein [Mucilaginibacter sp. 21P]